MKRKHENTIPKFVRITTRNVENFELLLLFFANQSIYCLLKRSKRTTIKTTNKLPFTETQSQLERKIEFE